MKVGCTVPLWKVSLKYSTATGDRQSLGLVLNPPGEAWGQDKNCRALSSVEVQGSRLHLSFHSCAYWNVPQCESIKNMLPQESAFCRKARMCPLVLNATVTSLTSSFPGLRNSCSPYWPWGRRSHQGGEPHQGQCRTVFLVLHGKKFVSRLYHVVSRVLFYWKSVAS